MISKSGNASHSRITEIAIIHDGIKVIDRWETL
jgi:hypothetical protein